MTFLDLSPRMVELAQARGIDARQGDAQELPFADGTFDTVVAAWMLYHVPDVDRALAEFARVLVPGGALIAVTNSADHIAELRELVQHRDSWSHTFSRENGESSSTSISRRSSGMTPTWRCSSRAATQSSRIATRIAVPTSEVPERRSAAVHRARQDLDLLRDDMIRPAELIQRKRDGEELPDDELAELILGYARGEVPDYQMAAFCMAVFFKGLSPRETFVLTDAMIRSGETIDMQRGARAQGGRQALDRRGRRQDVARRLRRSSPRAASRSGR